MRKVLLSVLLAGSLLVITFQLSSNLNPVNSVGSSINTTHHTVINPNIDPIEA